jgi:hypothetical protein
MYANVTPKVPTSIELRNCEDIHIGQFCTEASNNVKKRCSNEWQEIIENNWCKPFQKDGLDLKSSEELKIVKQSISQRENYLDECKELGFQENTTDMAHCLLKMKEIEALAGQKVIVPREYKGKGSGFNWAAFAAGLNQINNSLNGGTGTTLSPSITCFKTGEVHQAFNKICNYSCNGTIYSVNTQSSTKICPLTIKR